ncbi:Sugar ABC transporter, ATP-binding protein [Rhodovulum sp. P5]|uniref:ABC transporter ATP-binding protein n=1 Tax=Rhodovulum sp. P5 TaxID=1564506 RepID=UPI0009C1FA9F|nr:ABC transporter ATP-binding protein [Rhodovulum sp. P5]ARE40342.1 Sugar ABC transporter, ATP-binding protein [Rhodovulum sp. P5]
MAQVEMRNLQKCWGRSVAVDGVSLTVENGEFVAILGPSGCGKSTTLFMLSGVYQPTGGEILFDGAVVNEVEARDRNVGIVFQSYALYPNMTVLQNILFPLRFQKAPDADTRARQMADLVQVGDLLDRRPSQLSGGQQQRVALARALVKRPNLLLLDEPLSNLDATLRLTMRAEIRRITRELGVTTILVTHDQLEATTMADRVICMKDGRIEQAGRAEDLYLRPETLFVAGFIGSPPMDLIPGSVVNGRLVADAPALSVNHDGPVTLGIRPEMLKPAEAGLPVTVLHVEAMGRETLYSVDSALGHLRFLEATTRPRWREGERLYLDFDPGEVLVFDRDGQRLPGATARLEAPAHA